MAKHTLKKRKGPRFSPQFIKRLSSWLVLSTALTLAVRSATNLYWDGDGTNTPANNTDGTNLGGSGTWDTATSNWWDGVAATDTTWQGGAAVANFVGPAGTVTVTPGGITAAGLTFNSSGFNLTGGTITLNSTGISATSQYPIGITANASATIASGIALGASQNWTVAANQRLEVSGKISETPAASAASGASLYKSGNGTLVLSNGSADPNSFTGMITVSKGTLIVRDPSNLGANVLTNSTIQVGGDRFIGGGVLMLAPTNPFGTFTLNRNLFLQGGGMPTGNALNTAGQVNALSQGALTTIGGYVTINGTITMSSLNENRIAAAFGNLTLNGTLNLNGTQDLVLYGAGNIIINGQITGAGRLVKTQAGSLGVTLWLTNVANSNAGGFTGDVRIDNGTVRVSDGRQLGTSATVTAIRFNGGTLEVRADAAAVPSFATHNVSLVDNNGNIFVDRAIGGSSINQTVQFGAFQFGNISRTLTLNGRDGYGFSIGSVGANLGGNGAGGLAITTGTINGLTTINGNVTLGDNTGVRNLAFNTNGDAVWNGGLLAASGALIPNFSKTGSGTLTMNSFVGGTASGATTAATTLTVASATGIGVGEVITGAGIPVGTTVTAIAGNVLTLSQAATVADTTALTFGGMTITGGTSITGGTLVINNIGGASGGSLNGVAGGVLNISSGVLNYTGGFGTGAGETTAKAINLNNTGSGIIFANQTGSALTLTSNIASAGSGGTTKNLFLGGTNTAQNTINGVLSNTTVGAASAIFKIGTGTWLYSPTASNYVDPTLLAGSSQTLPAASGINTATLTLTSTAGLSVGQAVTGVNIPAGAYIVSIAGNNIVLNAAIGGTAVPINTVIGFSGLAATVPTTAAANANTNVITVGSTSGLVVGQVVTGTNIPSGAIITAITGPTTFTISTPIASTVASATSLFFGAVQNFTGDVFIAGGTLQIQPTAISGNGSNVINDSSRIVFQADTYRGSTGAYANGTFEYLGLSGQNSSETVGQLILTGGSNTVKATPVGGGGANLNFAGTTVRLPGSTVNYVASTGTISQNSINGTAGTTGFMGGYAYYNGADYAYLPTTGGAVRAAIYGSDAGFSTPDTVAANTHVLLTASQSLATGNLTLSSLKLTGAGTTMTLASGQTLTLDSGTGVASGILVSGGSSATITGGTGITAGTQSGANGGTTSGSPTVTVTSTTNLRAGMSITGTNIPANTVVLAVIDGTTLLLSNNASATTASGLTFTLGNDLVIRTDSAADSLTLATPITNTTVFGVTKSGLGTLNINSVQSYTGATTLNEGKVVLGVGGTLGSVNNNLVMRTGTSLDIGGQNLGVGGFNGDGTVTNNGGNAILTIGNNNQNGTFNGVIQNGTGTLALTKVGSGTTMALTGQNTFTGPVTLTGGTLQVTSLGNIGAPSSLGRGDATNAASNAASLVFNGGALQYIGAQGGIYQTTQTPTVSIDRLFTLAGNGVIASDGTFGTVGNGNAGGANNAALIFNNTGAVAYTTAGARTLTLQGGSQGDNEIDLQLINNTNGGAALSLTKTGTGLWILGNTANNYSGATTITQGILRAQDGAGLSSNSNLVFNAGGGVGGVLEMTGTFTRALGTGAGQVQWNNNLGGGFAASTAPLTVNIGGQVVPTTLTWGLTGAGNFMQGNGGSLVLNSATALAEVNFVNPINFGSGYTSTRIVQVDDNGTTNTDWAILSGQLSGTAGANTAAFTKTGGGILWLAGNNTFTGGGSATAGTGGLLVNNGTVVISGFGNNSSLGALTGANDALNRVVVGAGGNTTSLLYVGGGETVLRRIELAGTGGTSRIENDGSGALILTDITNTNTGSTKTLNLRGTNIDRNEISANLANNAGIALALTKDDSGLWILSGNNSGMSGTLTVNGGVLLATNNNAFGTGTLQPGNAAIGGTGADLTFSQPYTQINNTTTVFTGSSNITFTNTVSDTSGNLYVITNSLDAGKTLTFAGNVTQGDAGTTRTLTLQGVGTTVISGLIRDQSTNGKLTITYSGGTNANVGPGTLKLSGTVANTFTGGFNLTAGILDINMAGSLNPLGTGIFAATGTGFLQAESALTGANALAMDVAFGSTSNTSQTASNLIIQGVNNIDFSGTVRTDDNNNTLTVNGVTAHFTKTGASAFGLLGNLTSRTFTVQGTGNVIIDGSIVNSNNGAPVLTTNTTTTVGSSTVTVASATNLVVGQGVTGTGIPANTTITAISGTTITLSQAATAAGTVTGTFQANGSLTKSGLGTLTLNGNNSYTGTTTINDGILQGNVTGTSTPLGSGLLTLGGGTLALARTDAGTSTQNVGVVSLTTNTSSHINVNAGSGSLTLNTGIVTRNPGNNSTVEFNLTNANSTVNVGTSGLGGWATLKTTAGNFFATKNGSNNVVALASTTKDNVSTWVAGDNVTDDGAGYSGTFTMGIGVNTIRFNGNGGAAGTSTVTIDPNAILNVSSNGILVTSNVGAQNASITGGTLTGNSSVLATNTVNGSSTVTVG
ncbi:MAG: beta strand repeat-containing protein, partial [Chthoniobacter sp.]